LRYGIVGLASNGIGYVLYLLLTWLGMEYRMAVTVVFLAGVVQTFVFNKRWSFAHSGTPAPALLRYWAVYVAGYFLNIAALTVLVEYGDVPHQIAQGILVFVIAGLIFFALRFWVFPREAILAYCNDSVEGRGR
jgi:putative flippase GtrA